MPKWTSETEEELTRLVKDWLKSKGKSQVDLRESLQASSSRMPALIEVLRKEYSLGGIAKVAQRLCLIEIEWDQQKKYESEEVHLNKKNDPFNQLDLLLEQLREDFTT